MLNTKTTVKLACCIALALGTVARAAQQKGTSAGGERGDLDEIRKVSTMIGTHVMNRASTQIADLRNLVLSPDGAILYAVLGYGGVAGVGETYTVAPFDALEVRLDDGKWAVNLDVTSEDLKKAPTIHSENYRELTDPQWIARIDQFFRPRAESQGTSPSQRERRAVERVLLSTKICAAKPKNTQDEELGKVEDLLLDRQNRVIFAVLGRGGVLGVGESYIPVPWSKLRISSNQENAAATIVINATKAQLEKAPLIKGDNYATMLAPGFADEVRRYFGVTIGAEKE